MAPVIYAHSGSPWAAVLVFALTLVSLPIEGTSDISSPCLGELFLIFQFAFCMELGEQFLCVGDQLPASLH